MRIETARPGELRTDLDTLFGSPTAGIKFLPGYSKTYAAHYPFSATLSLVSGGGIVSSDRSVGGNSFTQAPALFGVAWEPFAESRLRPIVGFGTGGIYTNSVSGGSLGWSIAPASEVSAGVRYRLSAHSLLGITGNYLELPRQNSVIRSILVGYSVKF